MTDTEGDRPGRRRLTGVNRSRLTAGFLGAAASLVIWTLARARVLPPWPVMWGWLEQWWPAVVGAGLAVAVLVLHRRRPRSTSADPRDGEGRWTRLTTLVTAFTAVAALVFTALSLSTTRDQIGITEQGQFTDRYTKAIDQLGTPGAEHLWVRVGGIFALERVANDSPRDQRAIVEVLGAFLRTAAHRPDPTTVCSAAPADIDAAFLVLTRRQVARETHDPPVIDLRNTCLVGIRATGADLSGISLIGSDLHDADLPKVHGDLIGLSKIILTHANLYSADLSGYAAGFTDADLSGARLSYAKFGPNELIRVKLVNADLTGADLRDVVFTGVDLTGAQHDSSTKTTGAKYDATTTGAWW
ncbi:MAG: putative secreted protein [Amycolatopsis sp.]|uniref:pentapeptide repeat-containing protein n=1 Tax=Amycolatopsis sp. TaxID=37632 RepID=UPI00261395F7|nr:pentapeptide repeat-containing protein [Amycolatopsis sp.]MCU1687390.1 putative secreted protein [Amycolatopsis sp.]